MSTNNKNSTMSSMKKSGNEPNNKGTSFGNGKLAFSPFPSDKILSNHSAAVL